MSSANSGGLSHQPSLSHQQVAMVSLSLACYCPSILFLIEPLTCLPGNGSQFQSTYHGQFGAAVVTELPLGDMQQA